MFLRRTLALIALFACGATSASRSDPTGRFVTVGDGRLWCESAGVASAPAVVLLHDGLLPSCTWDDVWSPLAHSAHVVRYDRRGMGRSDPPRSPFIPTEDLLALLDSLGIARATLVGSSSGSGLAIDFAIRHPDRVERLVLAGPVLHGMASSEHFLARGARNNAPLDHGDSLGAADRWAQDRWQVAGSDPALRKRLAAMLRANAHDLRYDGRLERRFAVPAIARLAEIRVPTLILVGESDIADVQAYAGAIEAGIPGARREVVAGAGHLVQIEKPAEFVSQVTAFIDQHPVIAVPDSALRRWTGIYEMGLFGLDTEFLMRDGRLFVHVPTERDLPIFPASDSTFYALPFGGCRFSFRAGASGLPATVEIEQGGQRVRASRRSASAGG